MAEPVEAARELGGPARRTGTWSMLGVVVMAVLLAFWLGVTVWYAIVLFRVGEWIATVMGAALIVLPLIAAWWLLLEIRFLIRGQRLIARLDAEHALPVDDLPRLPSGRVDPTAGKAEFPAYQAEVEANEDDWRAWVRLSLAYDAAGDRPHARWAMRRAIALQSEAVGPQDR